MKETAVPQGIISNVKVFVKDNICNPSPETTRLSITSLLEAHDGSNFELLCALVSEVAQFPKIGASDLLLVGIPLMYNKLEAQQTCSSKLMLMKLSERDQALTLLVETFMRSSLPPVDLLRVGFSIGEAQQILTAVYARFNGQEYFDKIEAGILTLPNHQVIQLNAELAKFWVTVELVFN